MKYGSIGLKRLEAAYLHHSYDEEKNKSEQMQYV